MFKKGSFSSNFLVLFSGNTIAQIIPFLFQPLITRLFSTEDIATHRNFLALASMIAIAAAGRYEMAIVLPSEKSKAMNLVGVSMRLIGIVTVSCILFYIFRDHVDSFYKEGGIGQFLIFLLAAVPLYAITNVLSQWLIRERQFKSLTSSGILRSTFSNLFTVLFGYLAMGVFGLIAGTLIGFGVALVLMYISSINTLDGSLITKEGRKEVTKSFKDFPMINAPHAFVDLLFSQFILFAIITREFGLKELGYYAVMTSLLLASMRAIGGAVGQLYYREASDLKENGGDVAAVLFRSVRMVSLFAIPACVGVFFFGPELFGWYLGSDINSDYTKSGEYAQLMIFPFFLNFIVSPISGTPIIYRKQTQAFVYSLIGYIASIAAFMIGNHLDYTFKESLILFAGVQSLYYFGLFVWYISLTKKRG